MPQLGQLVVKLGLRRPPVLSVAYAGFGARLPNLPCPVSGVLAVANGGADFLDFG